MDRQRVLIPGFGHDEPTIRIKEEVTSSPYDVEQDQQYNVVVDVENRCIRVLQEFDPELFVLLETINGEQYNLLGQKVSEGNIDKMDDSYIHCDQCSAFYAPSCLEHPLYLIKDRAVSNADDERAKKTLPAFFRIRPSSIPNAGLGVFTTVDIPVGAVFGPYQGILMEDAAKAGVKGYSWEIRAPHPRYVDGSDMRYSNWMRFINSSRHDKEQNLIAFQYNGSVYYRVFRPISNNQELLVWYGKKYGESLGVLSVPPPFVRKPAHKNPFIL